MEPPEYIKEVVKQAVNRGMSRKETESAVNEKGFDEGDNPDDYRAEAMEMYDRMSDGEKRQGSGGSGGLGFGGGGGNFGFGGGGGGGGNFGAGDPDSDFL